MHFFHLFFTMQEANVRFSDSLTIAGMLLHIYVLDLIEYSSSAHVFPYR